MCQAGDQELLCVTSNEKHAVIACGGNDCELRLWRLANMDKVSTRAKKGPQSVE